MARMEQSLSQTRRKLASEADRARTKARQSIRGTVDKNKQKLGMAFERSKRVLGLRRELMKRNIDRLVDRASRVVQQHGDKAQKGISNSIDRYGTRVTEKLVGVYERHGRDAGDHVVDAMHRHAPEIVAAVKDPKDSEKVVCAALTVLEMRANWKETKRTAAYEGLRAAGKIKIDTPRGLVSLEDHFRHELTQQVPYLVRSSIVEDPAEFIVYGIVARDPNYLIKEMRVLPSKKGNRKISMLQYAAETRRFDADKTLAVLDLMEKSENMRTSLESGVGVTDSAQAWIESKEQFDAKWN